MEETTTNDDFRLTLRFQSGTGQWTTTSIYGHGAIGPGTSLSLDRPEVIAGNPYDDENSTIAIYGGNALVFSPTFTPDSSIMENEDDGSLSYVIRRSSSNNNVVINDPTDTARFEAVEYRWDTALNDFNENRIFVAWSEGSL